MICLSRKTWSIIYLEAKGWFGITLDGHRCGPYQSWKQAYNQLAEIPVPINGHQIGNDFDLLPSLKVFERMCTERGGRVCLDSKMLFISDKLSDVHADISLASVAQ
jgi:hypothetical protein